MDEDLDLMSREQLLEEARKLRHGIREHRDSSEHELCWHHPALWSLLPERQDPLPTVPEWPQFMRGCIRYRQSLDDQLAEAPRSNTETGARDAAVRPTDRGQMSSGELGQPSRSALPAGLSRPALRALTGAGITNLKDLTDRTEAEVTRLHGMGPQGLRILRDALVARGLDYRP